MPNFDEVSGLKKLKGIPSSAAPRKGAFFLMELSVEFAKHCLENGWDRHYAHFLVFKRQYTDSNFRGYTSYRLAKKSGVSRSNVEKYVTFFISKKWCQLLDCGTLVFKRISEIMSEKGIRGTQKVKFKDSGNPRKVLDFIRLAEMKKKYEIWGKLKKIAELDNGNTKRLSRQWYTKMVPVVRIKKRTGFCAISRPIVSEKYKVSLGTIGKRISKSAATACRLIKKAEISGEIAVEREGLIRADTWEEKQALLWEEKTQPFSFFKAGRWICDFVPMRNSYVFL